jgi:hypothetical protein
VRAEVRQPSDRPLARLWPDDDLARVREVAVAALTEMKELTTADVAVDHTVADQIESERRASDEPDLLDQTGSGRAP